MTFEVTGRLYVKIVLAGVEFPFVRANSLEFLHSSASSKVHLPMIHLALTDPYGFFEKEGLMGDGIPMEISVSPSPEVEPHILNFRLNTPKKTHSSPNTRYELDGYLDVPKYWHDSTKEHVEGIASDVLQKIADDCGMEYEGESTNDFQVWWPGNRRYFEWAQFVSQRAFSSDESCLQLAVDFDKSMKLKDVNDLSTVDHYMTFMEPRDGHVLLTDVSPFSSSGSNNHLSGYGSSTVYQKLMENTSDFNVFDKELSVNPTSGERSFLRNTVIQGEVASGPVRFNPLDFGNTHDKYHRATYQNRRFEELFNLGLRVVTPEKTNIKLFENAELTINYPEGNMHRFSRHLSGVYKVVTKTLFVNGSNYYEAFTLVRRAYGDSTSEN